MRFKPFESWSWIPRLARVLTSILWSTVFLLFFSKCNLICCPEWELDVHVLQLLKPDIAEILMGDIFERIRDGSIVMYNFVNFYLGNLKIVFFNSNANTNISHRVSTQARIILFSHNVLSIIFSSWSFKLLGLKKSGSPLRNPWSFAYISPKRWKDLPCSLEGQPIYVTLVLILTFFFNPKKY